MRTQNRNQSFTSPDQWFSLQYPCMWEVEVVDGIPAFFDPLQGRGVLQILSVKLGSPDTIDEKLSEFPFLKGSSLHEKMRIF